MTVQRALAALALVFALAHVPFLAPSLEDIDSVNFALGVRDFDVAQHRPHPPGYPVYIALGKAAAAVTGVMGGSPSRIEARALAVLSLLGGLIAIVCLYGVFVCLSPAADQPPWQSLDVAALAATAITATCPLFWYLAARPMSDLPGLAFALAAQVCLMRAWWLQTPGPDGDRRLSPAVTGASGRMIVLGAFLAALSIGMRSQTVWYTAPLLVLVLFDRVGRGVAGAMIGGGVMFIAGGLAWGIPLLIASGGLNAYLAALGFQAGADFASGDMLYSNPTPRVAAFALIRTFAYPWDSMPLAVVVIALAAAGFVQLLLRDRRSLVALTAIVAPYLIFHLVFQDTAYVRYALPIVPAVAFLAVRGVMLVSLPAVPAVAALVSIAGVAVAAPVLAAYGAEPSPAVRVVEAMKAEARTTEPGALAMHQTYVRPLEAEDLSAVARSAKEDVGLKNQLPAPPRLEWLELAKHWKSGATGALWFLADPVRSDIALIDPMSRQDSTEFLWPLVARPAFGGVRPSAVRWYRMPPPGWFAEDGWALTPETAGIARVRGVGPHLGPITAMIRRRSGPARVLVGGRNLAGPNDPSARFTLAIDGQSLQQWDVAPGFFLKVFDVPAGGLVGASPFATLTLQSVAASGTAVIPTAIEQFDLQDESALMWGYGEGWLEAEYNPALGVWRWTTERATLRTFGPPRPLRVTFVIDSPLQYFNEAPIVRVSAGERVLTVANIAESRELTVDVPADALLASAGAITITTDKTFVPSEQGNSPDPRRLGLRVFAIRVGNVR